MVIEDTNIWKKHRHLQFYKQPIQMDRHIYSISEIYDNEIVQSRQKFVISLRIEWIMNIFDITHSTCIRF